MKNKTFSDNSCAASEVVGAIILVLIAVGAFAAIYYQVFSVPLPSPESHVKLQGYVTNDGKVVLEHVGGEPLTSYEIYVDGQLENQSNSYSWVIGECYLPNIDALKTTNDRVRITVYSNMKDGSKAIVFDGILIGKGKTSVLPIGLSILVSSLKWNTSDEDLICYPSSIIPNIYPSTFIFNWTVDNSPINRLLFPFDTNNSQIAKDYSGNKDDNGEEYNGTIIGAHWIKNGKLGGAYSFDGNDYITLPYCFASPKPDNFTVETWVNTTASSAALASFFNRTNYWELGITNGKPIWSTNANNRIKDTLGNSNLNNGMWHQIAATYDSSTGNCSIYVDGRLDKNEQGHTIGGLFGTGDIVSGYLGRVPPKSRQTIFSTGFEKSGEKNNWSENESDTVIDIKDYVDNNQSNVDRSSDKGTQSNFENEKNKDGVYDVLTEGNTGSTLLDDGFEGGDWDANWDQVSHNWGQTNSNVHSGSYAARSSDGHEGYFVSDDLDASSVTLIRVSFWYRLHETENNDFYLRYYDGSNYDFIADLGSGARDTWLHYEAFITDSQYFKSNFRLCFDASLESSNSESVHVDDVLIQKFTILLDDGFEGGDWDANWNQVSHNWGQTNSNVHSGSYAARSSDGHEGYFVSDDLDASSVTLIRVSFWYRLHETENNDFYLRYYDGSNYDFIADLGSGARDTWLHYEAFITDSQYFKSNFRLCFDASLESSNSESVHVDDVLITKKETPDANYKLDLEVQWTNVNYQLLNEEFCIYTGDLGSENIIVDAWNGSNWITVFNPLLPSQWNNVSITNWLTSPTFTIRYRDGTPTNDQTRNTWNIDAALLHLRTTQGIFDILPSTALIPYNGSYSIGGSGDFDPDYAVFNRTGIDISNYKNVTVSIWYSYKNTQSTDFLGFYYRYNHQWIPIFVNNSIQIGAGQQSNWTNAQVQLPSELNVLILQFKWRTSATNAYVAIDDLEVTGKPLPGENFTGIIDEFHIYNRVLSPEQIYQNYLCTKDGYSNTSVIVSEETANNNIWRCFVTPNNSDKDDFVFGSETLLIRPYQGGE
ncbi:MAG: type IV pilin [Thermoplasmata archaeon]|nr:type IV pilin [Thermoplasmata archaeon]